MSYILDALRRAEADRERERGQVPGLHTQPLPGSSAAAAGKRRWLPWAGGGLLLLAGIGAGSWWAGTPPQADLPAAPSAPPLAASAPVATAPAQPAASAPLPPPAASASPYLPPLPLPAAVVAAPAPPPRAAPAPAPAAEAPVPRLSELPESLRNELPRLTIGGSMYSDDPASRLLIVNGEVMREGARLGPDLVLEQIRPREVVLRFKGQRFRQPV
jgi:general secretion pathway protein B